MHLFNKKKDKRLAQKYYKIIKYTLFTNLRKTNINQIKFENLVLTLQFRINYDFIITSKVKSESTLKIRLKHSIGVS